MRKIVIISVILFSFFSCIEKTKKAEPPRDGVVYEGDSLNFLKKTYKGGNLASEEPFVNGRMHGEAKYYYPNGKLRRTIEYKEARRNGLFVYYYDTGEKYSDEQYVNGKVNGLKQNYMKNGTVTMSCSFVDGKPVPPLEEYDAGGKKIKQPTVKFTLSGGTLKMELSDRAFTSASFFKIEKDKLVEIPTEKGVGRLAGAKKGVQIRAYYKSPRGAEGAVDVKY
ncbi:MAG: hypothetical protein LBD76_04315 [Prevotellaceae bacterium]|jgi:hypothetical protein|nr:hypothetical protein [Prevotellaceae bacterium]